MKHVMRRLARTPLFSLAALLTLGTGIGAYTAIFSVIDAVVLKPLPYPHPEELVSVVHSAGGLNIRELPMSPACYFLYRSEGRSFRDLALWNAGTVNVTGLGEPEQVNALNVTGGMLNILGVQPVLGRGFAAGDDTPGNPEVALLTHGYWQRRFGGDPSVVGRLITVDASQREVIGVLPQRFRFLGRQTDLVIPFQFDPAKVRLGNFSYGSIARLKEGVTIDAASQDVARMIPLLYERYPPPDGSSVRMFAETRMAPSLRPLKQDVVGNAGSFLWVLMGAIGAVLLIACANVANLMLVRVEARQQEFAIRTALGAGWRRICGGMLVESVTLAAAGGLLGLAFANAALRVLVAIAPANLPRIEEISIDPAAMLFAALTSLACGLLFGLVPALRYRSPEIANAMRLGARTLGFSRERRNMRNTLVVVQVALAMVLLAAAGLMIRTFQALRGVQPGFSGPDEILTLALTIPSAQVPDDERVVRMEQEILNRIAAVPGIVSASFASRVPMDGNSTYDSLFVEDQPETARRLAPPTQMKFAAPGFFRTMGNRLLAGRDYTWDDIYGGRPVAIVTENLARRYWGNPGAALGKRVRESLASPWREVIGVVGSEHDKGVDQPAPATVYWPALVHEYWGRKAFARRTVTFVVRSPRAGSQAFVSDIRRAVWSVDSDLPVAGVRTMREIYSGSMTRTTFVLVLLAIAGAMAVLIGVIGIYSVIAYSVSQRTREIGIRMAAGAGRGALIGMYAGRGVRLALAGVAVGLVAASALTRGMASLLFGVAALDPLTYAVVAGVLLMAAGAASYFPARRASGIDPVAALRAD